MKHTPRPFDNSDEAKEILEKEILEAQEFVFGWLNDTGLWGCGSGLDFDDIFKLMVEYKRQSTPILTP